MYSTTASIIGLPITIAMRDTAHQFSLEQTQPERAFKIYLNTVSVKLIQRYLTYLDIESYFYKSDLFQPEIRASFEPADLMIANFGKVECRWFMDNQTEAHIPPEAQENRRGCFIIRLEQSLQQAEVLGFYAAINDTLPATISLTQLQSIETFINMWKAIQPQPINLHQWLHHDFETSWQALEEIITPKTPILAFPSREICRAKILNLGIPLVLAIALQSENESRLQIQIELFPYNPTKGENNLNPVFPQALYLTILTATGEVFRCLNAQSGDEIIQYEFVATRGEEFSLKIESPQATFIKHFIA
ncbi:MAG: DUF1822 family protein [Spirulinaceae cyanobacterium]